MPATTHTDSLIEPTLSPLDQIDVAMQNAIRGRPAESFRALAAPDTLAPVDRRTLTERFGIVEPGPLKTVLETTSNPGVVLGAILTWRYPVQGTRSFFSQRDQFTKGLKPLLPILDDTASFAEIYKGTQLPAIAYDLGGRVHHFQHKGSEFLKNGVMDYLAVAGEKPTAASEIRVGLYRMQKNGYLDAVMKEFRDRIGKVVAEGHVPKDLAERAIAASKKLPKIELTVSEQRLNDKLGEFYDWAHDQTGADHVDGIEDAIRRKGVKHTLPDSRVVSSRTEKPRIGKYQNSYLPAIMDRDPAYAQVIQSRYAGDLLSGGAKEAGLKIAGRGKMTLTPSELSRLLGQYTEEVKAVISPESPEFLEGFHKYLGKFYTDQTMARTAKVASGSHLARYAGALPSHRALERIGGEFGELGVALKDLRQYQLNQAPAEIRPELEWARFHDREFRLDSIGVSQSYNHMRARDYGWSVKPEGAKYTLGESFSRIYRELAGGIRRDDAGNILEFAPHRADPVRAAFLRDTYMPAILGNPTYRETMWGQRWDAMRMGVANSLDSEKGAVLGTVLDKIGAGKLRTTMMEGIANSRGLGYAESMSTIARYFYWSTLGAPNLIAPIKNLFQTLITTYPMVGAKSTAFGLREAAKSFQSYFDERFLKKVPHELAFRKAFGDFADTAFTMDDSFLQAIDQTEQALIKGGSKTAAGLRKAQKLSMSLFSTTELWNRAVAHKAFSHDAWKQLKRFSDDGLAVPNHWTNEDYVLPKGSALFNDPIAQNLAKVRAAEGVAATQFGGGITNLPKVMAEWPQPLRMLTQFPVRLMNMVARGGPAVWGRALLGTGLAIGAAKLAFGSSGEKIAEEASLFGAVPMPREGSPFYPLPLVPPVVQLAGGGVIAATTGDTTQLQRSLPLLVPGGVGLSRIAPNIPGIGEAAGKLINRSYVDSSKRGPDGRYPMFTPKGNLIGFYSPSQLVAKSMGLGDVQGQQELAVSQWLVKYAPRVADMKRQYIEAIMANDIRGADAIETEFKRVHPGYEQVPLSASQMRAIHLRQDVSRTERMLETLPPETREQFLAAMSVAFAGNPGFLGLQDGGFDAGRTVRERDPYRLRPQTQLPGREIQEAGEATAASMSSTAVMSLP